MRILMAAAAIALWSSTMAQAQGVKVVATARYVGREKNLFVFEIVAHDPGGEIGRGSHKRAIISMSRLLSGAARRNGTA